MPDIKEHDNVDKDVIKINKDSLLLRIIHCKEHYISQTAAPTLFGVSISLLIPGFISESFKNVGAVPGETIRMSLLVLGVVALVFSGYFAWKWYWSKDAHNPNTIIKNLTESSK